MYALPTSVTLPIAGETHSIVAIERLEESVFKAVFRLSIALVFLFLFFPRNVAAQIAPGVQQSAAQTATVTGVVTQSDGTPVSGADVRLIGSAMLKTRSDAHGAFAFTSVPYGVYKIVATTTIGTASRDNVAVKGDISVAIQYVTQNGTGGFKTIARVSTRSSGAQINVTPASIASVNPSDYAFRGNTSWRQLLNQIPGVTVGGNLNSTIDAIPDSPLQPVILSINGALPYETSVTLDGMPLVNTSYAASPGNGTDLTYLPLTTFDTADVVRGPGANAPSIINSIGGSFVLHPPGRVDRNQFEFSTSNDPYGGIVANAKMSLDVGKLSTTLTYGLNNSPGPLGNQNIIPALDCTPATINGQTAWSGGFIGVTGNPNYANDSSILENTLLFAGVPVSTSWRSHSGAIALSYAFSPSVSAQVFYAGSSSELQLPLQKNPVSFIPGAGYAGSLVPGLYTFIQADGPETVTESSSVLEEKITSYIGRGILRLAALQNNSYEFVLTPDLFPNGQYTLYGTANVGPTFPGTTTVYNGTLAYLTFPSFVQKYDDRSNNRDLLASYAIQIGSATNAGISYVSSYYNNPLSYSAVYDGFLLGFLSGSESSAVNETTREIRLHAGTEIAEKIDVDASWYIMNASAHVQNPADTTGKTYVDSLFHDSAPRLSVVWHVNGNTAVRASAGGGYAVPPLGYLIGKSAPFCFAGVCTVTRPNLSLQPETSFGFDIGTDIRINNSTVLSVDLYRTNLYGQFFQSTNLNGTYTGLPLYVTQYGNLSQSRFEGINFDIRRDVPHGIYWHAMLGLTRGYVVSVPAGFYDDPSQPCTNCTNTYIVPGINFDGQFQSTVPYANGSAQIGYRWSPNKYLDLSPTYYGNNNPYFEPAFLEFDAHGSYPLSRYVSLLATFRNMTGIYGQNYRLLTPTIGAENLAGLPFAGYGVPVGPRSVIVTINFKQ